MNILAQNNGFFYTVHDNLFETLENYIPKYGHHAAGFVNQLEYWLNLENAKIGAYDQYGRKWIYNRYPDWLDRLPHMCRQTFAKIVRTLEEMGVIITTRFEEMQWSKPPSGFNTYNRTKFYRLNYEVLNLLKQGVLPKPPDEEIERHTQNDNTVVSPEKIAVSQPCNDVSFLPLGGFKSPPCANVNDQTYLSQSFNSGKSIDLPRSIITNTKSKPNNNSAVVSLKNSEIQKEEVFEENQAHNGKVQENILKDSLQTNVKQVPLLDSEKPQDHVSQNNDLKGLGKIEDNIVQDKGLVGSGKPKDKSFKKSVKPQENTVEWTQKSSDSEKLQNVERKVPPKEIPAKFENTQAKEADASFKTPHKRQKTAQLATKEQNDCLDKAKRFGVVLTFELRQFLLAAKLKDLKRGLKVLEQKIKKGKKINNPSGFLRSAIEKDWQPEIEKESYPYGMRVTKEFLEWYKSAPKSDQGLLDIPIRYLPSSPDVMVKLAPPLGNPFGNAPYEVVQWQEAKKRMESWEE